MADTTPDLSVLQSEFITIRNNFAQVRIHRQDNIKRYINLAKEDSNQAVTSVNNGNLLLRPSEWDSEAGRHASNLFEELRIRAREHHNQRVSSLDGLNGQLDNIWTP